MLRVAAASSLVALSVGCQKPQCGHDCELVSPPAQGDVEKLDKLKQRCVEGEEVVFNVDYDPCTHSLEYKVNTPNRCELKEGNTFTCKNNRKCKVTPFLTELKHCDCSKCDNHHCEWNQECTLQEVNCLLPCGKQPVCAHRPCNLQCADGMVCKLLEADCPSPPCDPISTCVPVDLLDPCGGECDFDETCELKEVSCLQEPCDPIPTCVDRPCTLECDTNEECRWKEVACLQAPCDPVQECVAEAVFHICLADVMHCPDGTVLKRDNWNECRFPPCPDTVDHSCGGKCNFDQTCLLEEGRCVDRPCTLECDADKNEVCRWKEVACLQAPCDPVQECGVFTPICPADVTGCPDGTVLKRDHWNGCNFPPCP